MNEKVTEQEVTQYDRQIRLWGLEAQQRLRNAKIMVFGLGALGGEITKNLVLAGIGEINVCDSDKVDEKVRIINYKFLFHNWAIKFSWFRQR